MIPTQRTNERILLMLLPFWAPLNPPLGVSCLKSHLQARGFQVKTVDANTGNNLWEIHRMYLDTLQQYIPVKKQGNLQMIGYDIFMNHLMAHLHAGDEVRYRELVGILAARNFYVTLNEGQIQALIQIVEEFYLRFEKYLSDLLLRENPTIVGATVYNVSLAPSLFAFKWIKEHFPQITTLMGGGVFADLLSPQSPNFQEFLQRTPYIDKIFVGEGEHLFIQWLQGELPADQRVYTLADTDHQLMDLSQALLPDFSDFQVRNYMQMATYASRSCPFQCSFCSETVQWGKYRKKDAVKIADELLQLYQTYQRRLFILGDSLVNPFVTDLAQELIHRKSPIFWDGYLRADPPVCDPKNTHQWRQGGYYRARLGIESGSAHVLELMNKKTTPDQIKSAIASLAQAGIKTTTYWVIGHPGETEADFQQTLDLLAECKDNIYEADYHPFYYFPTGQVNSQGWEEREGSVPLYPEEFVDLLMVQTWLLKTEPVREEVYDRLCRFDLHCKQHNIPNPYSLRDIFMADQRWSQLHRNAVPPLIGFIS